VVLRWSSNEFARLFIQYNTCPRKNEVIEVIRNSSEIPVDRKGRRFAYPLDLENGELDVCLELRSILDQVSLILTQWAARLSNGLNDWTYEVCMGVFRCLLLAL
jgi:hypothetical protein